MNLVFKIARRILSDVDGHIKAIKSQATRRSRRRYTEQHQLTSTTHRDRYPQIFSAARTYCESSSPIILSFGSSTGEECFSLRTYFPDAQIIGADINERNLVVANKTNTDDRIIFILSDGENLIKNGPYDIIFAMSVLCRWEDTKDVANCERIYPFVKFEKTIVELARLLKPKGLLVVYNANFRVEDTAIGNSLKAYITPNIIDSGFVHQFDSENNRLSYTHNSVIFKKDENST